MINTLKLRFFFPLLLLTILSGCGFKLRGTDTQLSERFQHTFFDENTAIESDFAKKIKQLLTVNGANLVTRQQANIGIHITPIKAYSRQIALSGSGAIKEYERTFSTVVTLTDLKNGIQLGSRSIETTRLVQLDDRRVLAGEEQSEITKNAAEHALAQSIIRYLESF